MIANSLSQLDRVLEKMNQITRLKKYSAGVGLDRTRELMAHALPEGVPFPVVHVVGTAGKGSFATRVTELLKRKYANVGTIRSPHVSDIRERMTLNNTFPTVEQTLTAFHHTLRGAERMFAESTFGAPSYFEIVFLAALRLFADSGVDVAVVEAGIGGQYDTSNILENKIVNVLSSVGLDHTDILGTTVEAILLQKIGIARNGVPFVCVGLDARLQAVCLSWQKEQGLVFPWHFAETADDALRVVGDLLGISAENLHMPEPNPLPARLDLKDVNGKKLFIDIAHNTDKIRYAVARLNTMGYDNIGVVFGMVGDKQWEKPAEELLNLRGITHLYCTHSLITFREAANPSALADFFRSRGFGATLHISPYDALEQSVARHPLTVVIGSNYLGSHAYEFLQDGGF